jgi:energy-coupling factor transporter ATP-binding protein EcfA2
MKVESSELQSEEITGGAVAPLLFSKEFRWLYVSILSFCLFLGAALTGLGFYSVNLWLRFQGKEIGLLANGIFYFCGGLLVAIGALGVRQARRYFYQISKRTVAKIKSVELSKIKEEDFEQVDKILQIREEKARLDFQRNVADSFLIDFFELSGVSFFGPCSWRPRPGVNVLLGRNGYGKSLILRSLAALLQRNEEASKDLFAMASDQAFVQLTVQRNGATERIRRDSQRFTESAGKIPILAIPDSRFVNRIDISIEAPKDKDASLDLRTDGARHFLEDRPYGEMMQMLFNELCYDYLEYHSFDHPVFSLLQRVIEDLTRDRFRFHAVERVGRNSFRLLVLTEGNERPLPIQYASQGTLSVLGVVGIVHSYLRALSPDAPDEGLLSKPAIVIVDELDAHLHPLWQQKLTGILRDNFPNVQFVLSSHSPLIVAGCIGGEVAVLRKSPQGFVLTQVERDFFGTPVEEIYKVIFGVEDLDDSFLQSATRATSGFSNQPRISELDKKKEPTELERRELSRLIREEVMVRRAAEVKIERKDDQERIVDLEAKIEALQDELKTHRKMP